MEIDLRLSSPKGNSVNDGIEPDSCSMQYTSTADAIKEIGRLGRHTLLAKIDVKEAYRIIPVHPYDRALLGLHWQGNTYVDGSLPFGLRSVPKIFDALADMLNWILIDRCQVCILHYLDDVS